MKLDEAIGEQIVRFQNDEKPKVSNDNEIRNLLQAFVSLIQAYLKRVSGTPHTEPSGRSSNFFGSIG